MSDTLFIGRRLGDDSDLLYKPDRLTTHGVVIGMTPNAALAATVLYGWWSNHSYKSALAFAASCSLLGNVAYALALRHGSMHLILLGRGLNGFGSARAINRESMFSEAARGPPPACAIERIIGLR